ncbi:MAG: 3-dehydroquinate synthase [Bdellovibrionales bacterium]
MEVIKGPFGEEIIFKNHGLKTLLKKKNHYFFVDSFFKESSILKGAKNVLFLKAGEKLKTFEGLNKNAKWLTDHGATKGSTVVAVGGGSIGDSVGFLASVYLRGVDFIQVPTTWLAAVDSAVGGKTALNFNGYKNQIGTVYGPKEIYFFSDLLKTSKVEDSEGEIIKTLVLNINRPWAKKSLQEWDDKKIIFKDLKQFVSYKAAVVKKDINDQKGIRAVLNLGHTVGHALELTFDLSHSEAVKVGLLFAAGWSYKKKYLTLEVFTLMENALKVSLLEVKSSFLIDAISKDKKSSKDRVDFIFPTLEGPVVKKVKIENLVDEYQRQVYIGR